MEKNIFFVKRSVDFLFFYTMATKILFADSQLLKNGYSAVKCNAVFFIRNKILVKFSYYYTFL